jgi:hypothetical protein
LNLLKFFVIGLSFISTANAQDRKEVRRADPVRKVMFNGKQYTTSEYLANVEILESEKEKWRKESDRHSRLTSGELDTLSDSMIELRLYSTRNPISVDEFGISGAPLICDPYPKQWANLATEIRDELRDRKIAEREFVDFMIKLQERVRAVWDGVRTPNHPKRLTLSLELIDKYSRVRNRQETWLLVTLMPIDDDDSDSVFLRQLRTRIVGGGRFLQNSESHFVPPHPVIEEMKHDIEFRPAPKANRNPVAAVGVPSDSLSNEERSKLYNYDVVDSVGLAKQQYEGVVTSIAKDYSTKIQLEQLMRNVSDRISPGTIVSFDELHRLLGDSVKHARRTFGDDFEVRFELIEYRTAGKAFTNVKIVLE